MVECNKVNVRNANRNNMSTHITFSKMLITKKIQSGALLGSLLNRIAGTLLKVAVPLTKNILAPLGKTFAASAIDSETQKKILRSGTTTLIILNEEMNEILKILQDLEDSNILLKRITKTTENKTKEQKVAFLGMLLGILGASLIENMLTGKGLLRAGYGNKEEKGILTAGC